MGGAGSELKTTGTISGGYNGGGRAAYGTGCTNAVGSGGGATHISKVQSGLLSGISVSNLLIVAGGGGGSSMRYCSATDHHIAKGGSGGGYQGNSASMVVTDWTYTLPTGGSQSVAGSIGLHNHDTSCNIVNGGYGFGGYYSVSTTAICSGGGGGYYGGGGGTYIAAGGGSGYIKNSDLISYSSVTKHMTGYGLTNTNNSDNSIRTQSTNQITSSIPAEADKARNGHGYARITAIPE